MPLGMARAVGAGLGRINWWLGSTMVKTTRINLALCLPETGKSERTLLAKASIINTFQTMCEAGAAWLWPAEKVLGHVLSVEGLPLLEAAAAQGKGVILIAPHLGNWEVLGIYLSHCGCGPLNLLYQPPRDEQIDHFIRHARSRHGASLVATDNKGVISLLKALKCGEIGGILPDQVPPESGGEFAPFFGKPALTMTLVSRLSWKTGARVIMGSAIRVCVDGKHGWHVVFQEPEPEIYAKHMQTSLAAMNNAVEKAVQLYPEQYQWEYKRFKRMPAGENRPY